MNKYERGDVITKFKSNSIVHLISTPLISRGFDQRNVALVINYNVPLKYIKDKTA